MDNLSNLGIAIPEFLIPRNRTIMQKWAVVACDQYTSEPEYWDAVKDFVGDSPSTYHLVLPEAYLGTDAEEQHRSNVNQVMNAYLNTDFFETINAMAFIERTIASKVRRGLLVCLDLEKYDYSPDSKSLIRATEGTIIDRLPPRIKIREKAALEIPHILVLIDDPDDTVIGPLNIALSGDLPLYDTDLMQNGGQIKGFRVSDNLVYDHIAPALEILSDPAVQKIRYGLSDQQEPLLYAVGDGNHSLATAKSVWENHKKDLPENHPARYALVEIVNLYDAAIEFEAIHRLVFNANAKELSEIFSVYDPMLKISKSVDFYSMCSEINSGSKSGQRFGLFDNNGYSVISIGNPEHTLSVGTVTNWLDRILKNTTEIEVDYIHGDSSIHNLGTKSGHAGIYLPAMPKNALFKSVIKNGPLPRKTFSMGESNEKRFYLECRIIC